MREAWDTTITKEDALIIDFNSFKFVFWMKSFPKGLGRNILVSVLYSLFFFLPPAMNCVNVAATAFPHVWREIQKCIWLEEDIKNLVKNLENFEIKIKDIDNDLEKRGQLPSAVVDKWKNDVKKAEEEVAKLAKGFEKSFKCRQRSGCGGGCRNFWHGERISQQVDDNNRQKIGPTSKGYSGLLPYCWHKRKIRGQVDYWISEMKHLDESHTNFQGNYAGIPIYGEIHPGRYSEKYFEPRLSEIKEWLLKENVGIIGIHGEESSCTTSLLRHLHNNVEVRNHFEHKIFYIETPSSAEDNIETARKYICGRIGLEGPSSKNDLYTRWKQRRFDFLLLLAGLEEGFDIEGLKKMVEDIGLPSFQEKQPQVVFTCRSKQVVSAMNAEETSIEIPPEEAWDFNLQEEIEKAITGTGNPDESSKDTTFLLDKTSLICLSCTLINLTETENVRNYLLIIFCFSVVIFFCMWLRPKETSVERRTTPAQKVLEVTEQSELFSTEELESMELDELFFLSRRRELHISPPQSECSNTSHSENEIPQTKSDEWTEPVDGFRSSIQRELNGNPQQEIVPIHDQD